MHLVRYRSRETTLSTPMLLVAGLALGMVVVTSFVPLLTWLVRGEHGLSSRVVGGIGAFWLIGITMGGAFLLRAVTLRPADYELDAAGVRRTFYPFRGEPTQTAIGWDEVAAFRVEEAPVPRLEIHTHDGRRMVVPMNTAGRGRYQAFVEAFLAAAPSRAPAAARAASPAAS